MKEIILSIQSSQALLSRVEEGMLLTPEKHLKPSSEHPLIWIAKVLQSASPASLAVLSSPGRVEGGVLASATLGNIDLLDLVDTQLRAPAIIIPEGHAVALAASAQVEGSALAVHIGEELSIGFWDGSEVLRGENGEASQLDQPPLIETLQALYYERSGIDQAPRAELFASTEEAREAREALAGQISKIVAEAAQLTDPGKIVISGGALWNQLQEFWKPEGDTVFSPWGDTAPLQGAARVLGPAISLAE